MTTTGASTVDRRKLLVTAVATTAAAAALPGSASSDTAADARLLALNAELDRLWQVAWSLHAPWRTAIEGAEAELRRRTKGKKPGVQMTMTEAEAWLDQLYQLRAETGVEDLNRRHNAAWQACDGKLHRCNAAGKNGKNDASYLLFVGRFKDGSCYAVGGLQNWRLADDWAR